MDVVHETGEASGAQHDLGLISVLDPHDHLDRSFGSPSSTLALGGRGLTRTSVRRLGHSGTSKVSLDFDASSVGLLRARITQDGHLLADRVIAVLKTGRQKMALPLDNPARGNGSGHLDVELELRDVLARRDILHRRLR